MPTTALTKRQTQILALLQRGLSRKHIARELHIALGTVCIHIGLLLRNTGYSSTKHLVCDTLKEQNEQRNAGPGNDGHE